MTIKYYSVLLVLTQPRSQDFFPFLNLGRREKGRRFSSSSDGDSSSAGVNGKNDGDASMDWLWVVCVAVSPKSRCFAEVSARCTFSVADRLKGCLQDGDSSTQRFTEHCCSSSICIFWLLCLKSLTLNTNPSHFLQISFDRESSSVMRIPHAVCSRRKIFIIAFSAENSEQMTTFVCTATKPANWIPSMNFFGSRLLHVYD